ncbi:hypothetical protein [Yersinia aldovae]|uniref:hypothetical protein n=1 Tax=Yersinia aldovae TaxID=29483 RepID=UPI00119EA18F|nr:hypothetical protein [Yersinia aldovae]
MNNFDELSKPVAEVNSKYGDPEAFGERELNVLADIQKMPYQTKFYSQEYVDSLITQLEAAQRDRNLHYSVSEKFRIELIANEAALSAASEKLKGEQVPVAWTDAEELRGMENDGCGYLFKIDPANPFTDPRRKIMLFTAPQKPVVLPERYSFDCGVCADPNGEWVAVDDIKDAIKAAGGTVEGNADA